MLLSGNMPVASWHGYTCFLFKERESQSAPTPTFPKILQCPFWHGHQTWCGWDPMGEDGSRCFLDKSSSSLSLALSPDILSPPHPHLLSALHISLTHSSTSAAPLPVSRAMQCSYSQKPIHPLICRSPPVSVCVCVGAHACVCGSENMQPLVAYK